MLLKASPGTTPFITADKACAVSSSPCVPFPQGNVRPACPDRSSAARLVRRTAGCHCTTLPPRVRRSM
eukprot:scaffold52890_cov86-Phaeocystis_antarctica.AAC.1